MKVDRGRHTGRPWLFWGICLVCAVLVKPVQDHFESRRGEFLPTREDRQYVKSVQFLVTERGKFANWIAPPQHGINGRPLDFEYVRL